MAKKKTSKKHSPEADQPKAEKDKKTKSFDETMEEFGEKMGEMGKKVGREIEMEVGKKIESPARKFGYLVAIVVNVVMLFVAHNLTKWGFAILDFIKDEYDSYLWAIDLSIAVSIIGNTIFFFYNAKLFKAFIQAIMNFFAIIVIGVMFIYFPFDFRELINVSWINTVVRIGHLFVIFAIIIGTSAELIKALPFSEPEKE